MSKPISHPNIFDGLYIHLYTTHFWGKKGMVYHCFTNINYPQLRAIFMGKSRCWIHRLGHRTNPTWACETKKSVLLHVSFVMILSVQTKFYYCILLLLLLLLFTYIELYRYVIYTYIAASSTRRCPLGSLHPTLGTTTTTATTTTTTTTGATTSAGLCSRSSEDCRSTGCCQEAGYTCALENCLWSDSIDTIV